jgi:hypothetical protein
MRKKWRIVRPAKQMGSGLTAEPANRMHNRITIKLAEGVNDGRG